MSLRDRLFGKPLASDEARHQELSMLTGIPVLGLDALASTGYGPEAALTALLPLGAAGLRYFLPVVVAIVILLTLLYFSYRQTTEAYPQGGGAYVVVRDNFGSRWGALAAVCLLLDYLLNVAVAISAGVGAMVSAFQFLHPHALTVCLGVLLSLLLVNLRGVRESGLTFVIPVLVFVACMSGILALGIIKSLHAGGSPRPEVPLPAIPAAYRAFSPWIVLAAFANGCTAMTGIEAVSNAVPLFREPKVRRAHATLTVIILVLGLFLLALGYLCPSYQISAMSQQQPGYQTILSQVVQAVVGRGFFYYVAITSIFIVLIYSAQTSFADFPRVCRFLAEDGFLPAGFANRGRRLVYSHGIVVLAILSGVLLVAFGGITDKLIPLFAVGAFGAFLSSQVGMVRHWMRKRGKHSLKKLLLNAVGAAATFVALIVLVEAKFTEGAWITLVVLPAMYLLLHLIHRHTERVRQAIGQAVDMDFRKPAAPVVIVPISGWNCVSEKALRFAQMLSDDITAVHVVTERDDPERLKRLWREKMEPLSRAAHAQVPRLEILRSPYRLLYAPILDFVNQVKTEKPDRLVAVVIPELVERRWYHFVLDNQYGNGLKALLYLKGDERTIVINTPWYLKEGPGKANRP